MYSTDIRINWLPNKSLSKVSTHGGVSWRVSWRKLSCSWWWLVLLSLLSVILGRKAREGRGSLRKQPVTCGTIVHLLRFHHHHVVIVPALVPIVIPIVMFIVIPIVMSSVMTNVMTMMAEWGMLSHWLSVVRCSHRWLIRSSRGVWLSAELILCLLLQEFIVIWHLVKALMIVAQIVGGLVLLWQIRIRLRAKEFMKLAFRRFVNWNILQHTIVGRRNLGETAKSTHENLVFTSSQLKQVGELTDLVGDTNRNLTGIWHITSGGIW